MYQSPGHKVATVMVGYICHRFKLGKMLVYMEQTRRARNERFESSAQLDYNYNI